MSDERTKRPLADDERAVLVASFPRFDDVRSHLTHLIYSTGAHPCVFSYPNNWNFQREGRTLTWNRPKTDRAVAVPLDQTMLTWLDSLVLHLKERQVSAIRINQLVHDHGERIGMGWLSPRTLRHDFAWRAVQKYGIIEAREYTGTTTEVLMGYARRELAAQREAI